VTDEELYLDPENDPSGILWILARDVRLTKQQDRTYRAEELDGNGRTCVLSFSDQGRLLFDGADVETEDLPAYVGMTDEADQSSTGVAIFRNDIVSYE
jgi:hypothetical protein